MSKFKPQGSGDGEATVQKLIIGGWDGPVATLQKEATGEAAGEKELDLSGRVEHRNGDGDVQELGRRIAQVYRRVAGKDGISHALSEAERRGIRDRMLEAMAEQGIRVTPELRTIASLLAGLRDELPVESTGVRKSFDKTETICPHCRKSNFVEITGMGKLAGLQEIRCSHCSKAWSEDLHLSKSAPRSTGSTSPELAKVMNETRAKLEILRERITKMLNDRAAAPASSDRFKADGLDKDAVAQQELRKALANGKPARFDGELIKKSNFQAVESVAPGVQMPSSAIASSLPEGAVVKRHARFQPQE